MLTLSQHRATCLDPTAAMDYLIRDAGNCIGVVRRSWGIGSLGGSALIAFRNVPDREMHYTDPLDVPEGAICYGLNGLHGQPLTRYGHAWIAARNLQGWSTDYSGLGTWKLAPMSLPRWTNGDKQVQWTSWTPYGRLPVGQTQRQRNNAVTYSYRQGKKVYSSKMRLGQMNSDSVWNLSLALRQKGFWRHPPINDYTPALRDACAAYQRSQGWSGVGANGIAGPLTIRRLGLIWVQG
jgi:hypothetical protein